MTKKVKTLIFIAVVLIIVIWAMSDRSKKSALSDLVQSARYSPTCDKMVAMQAIAGYPVPVKTLAGEKIYQIFFFGLNPSSPAQKPGTEPLVTIPSVVAEVHTDSASVCSRFVNSSAVQIAADYGPRFSAEASTLSMNDFDSRKNDLYFAIEKVAINYFNERDDQNAKDAANDFFDQFIYLSEPGLKQFYYDLNPDFWRWIEKLTGKKLVEVSTAATTSTASKGLDKVPVEARALLPRQGLMIVSGGLFSTSRRVIVDLDKKTAAFAVNPVPNTSVYGTLSRVDSAQLTNEQLKQINALLDDAIASGASNQRPLPDFDVILFLVRNNSVKVIDSFGPAVGASQKLYEYIWNLAPKNF